MLRDLDRALWLAGLIVHPYFAKLDLMDIFKSHFDPGVILEHCFWVFFHFNETFSNFCEEISVYGCFISYCKWNVNLCIIWSHGHMVT